MVSVTAVIQARMGSERLPGKILAELAGGPLLGHVIERTAKAQSVARIVLATSDGPADDAVEAFVGASQARWSKQVQLVRGSERDVLQRYEMAAALTGASHILRITGDCPLIDWDTIDALAAAFTTAPNVDYIGAGPSSGFPRGLDCELFTRAALDHAAREATEAPDREHVTRFLYMHPDIFRCTTMPAPAPLRRDYRLCVDEPLDLKLVRAIYERLWHGEPFEIGSVIALLDTDQALARTNTEVVQRAH